LGEQELPVNKKAHNHKPEKMSDSSAIFNILLPGEGSVNFTTLLMYFISKIMQEAARCCQTRLYRI